MPTAEEHRVLFMHGLESGPGGRKARRLQERYNAVAPDMRMSFLDLRRENSIARSALRNALTTLPWNLLAWALHDSLTRCLGVQARQIDAHKPHVVVASSWGAAVATLALARGVWCGPTLLLAPALQHAVKAAGAAVPELQPSAIYAAIATLRPDERARILIVHGEQDETIPLQNSREFAAAAGVRLLVVPGGDHALNEALLDDASVSAGLRASADEGAAAPSRLSPADETCLLFRLVNQLLSV